MNKVDADHDQERKEVYILVYHADDRLLSSSDKSEKAEDETAVQAAKTSEEDHDCDLVELDKRIFENVKTKMEALSSEIEVLVKLGQGAEIIRAKIQGTFRWASLELESKEDESESDDGVESRERGD
ncbi:hypothetical protein LWI29_032607 [Acer saccharum]|uniref:Uncharacterized protein n=1 Tax=Acer saccharum TaxID=4024 RepID=A0AA39T599_ACESA|nr:hypothetical protein LWI29_032607 [Acer saccharum]